MIYGGPVGFARGASSRRGIWVATVAGIPKLFRPNSERTQANGGRQTSSPLTTGAVLPGERKDDG